MTSRSYIQYSFSFYKLPGKFFQPMIIAACVLISGSGVSFASESEQSELFLRDTSLLAGKGKMNAELVSQYKRQTFYSGDALVKQESVSSSAIIRYGLLKNVETTATLPFSIANREYSYTDQTYTNLTSSGTGDISFHLKFHAVREGLIRPDLLLSLSHKLNNAAYPQTGTPPLGTGLKETSANITLVKSVDPAVYFSSIGYTAIQAATLQGIHVDPGHVVQYNLGVGYALSDQVVYGMSLHGSYAFSGLSHDLPTGRQHSVILQFTNTLLITDSWFVEPVIGLGLTPESPDFMIGISFPLWNQG